MPVTLLWLRRDLRLHDNPALCAAIADAGPVIPVFIHDDSVARLGAAPKWRLGLSLADLAARLEKMGSRLILRRGEAAKVLEDLVQDTGATTLHWSRLYDPGSIARDTDIKAMFKDRGLSATSHAGHVMFEPWTVETKTGGYYKVYSPMWRAVRNRDVPEALDAPARIPAPGQWPDSDTLQDWAMGAAMRRGAAVCLPHQRIGEEAALARLDVFTHGAIAGYTDDRNLPAKDGTSGLSENLTYGEISPRQCWHAGTRAMQTGAPGAETWLKELVWREFATHLMYHTPHILTQNWRTEWAAFPWNEDDTTAEVMAWKQGRTGLPFVDAAMREMYVTGKMHNRARMIVASYLCKHLLSHWRIGMKWFEDCLTDWDEASNAMGWQWSAGSGPDATPYFRVFNPETQLTKFDPKFDYVKAWIAEGKGSPSDTALSYFDAIPRSWGLNPTDRYPDPLIDLAKGRERALSVYKNRAF
ncbi:MAG: deoxyribodipyrimidine photo-lyase [Roseovarius sp.]